MDLKEKYYEQIRKKGYRLTDNRKTMIDILENKHLTFKQIEERLNSRGFYNVASIYNNLRFLIKEKIVIELLINDKKYYDLAMHNPGHDNDSHIHIELTDTKEITEIVTPDIFDYISNHKDLEHLDVKNIRIIISATHKEDA